MRDILIFQLDNIKNATTLRDFLHWQRQRAYFSTLRSHKSLEKHCNSRLCYLFAHLHLLSSASFSSLIFFLLLFSSLTLPTSAFSSIHIVGSLTSKLPSITFTYLLCLKLTMQISLSILQSASAPAFADAIGWSTFTATVSILDSVCESQLKQITSIAYYNIL